jgi:ATP-dependent protease HslVU (ClpYQ) peptidase subunit
MPKNGKHTRRPSVRNQMSHSEIMDKRYQKRKKKEKTYEGFVGSRHYHLKEYMKLTENEEVSKKSIARSIMDIVEEINDEGMNNKRYLDIMDQLMSLHNEGDHSRNDYLINSRSDVIHEGRNSFGTGSIGQFGVGSRTALTFLNEINTHVLAWSD